MMECESIHGRLRLTMRNNHPGPLGHPSLDKEGSFFTPSP